MIKHAEGKVLIKVNKEQKNKHTFSNGVTIELRRNYNNLNHSYTQQTLGEIISADGIPYGAMVLYFFNSLHETYKIRNHSFLTKKEKEEGYEIYAIHEEECYLWKMPGEIKWNPMKNYETAKRVFKPYEGPLSGIDPKKIKNVLYVETGELKGKVVHTLVACDAEIVFRNEKGVDERIIRFRPFGNEKEKREPEAIAIDESLTKLVQKGKYLIGLTPSDAKQLESGAVLY